MNLKSAIGYKIKPLSQFISVLLLSFWAIMFCESAFTVDYSLFNGLVTSKQKVVETCIPILLIIVPLVYTFKKQLSLTIIDIFIFLLAAYMLFVEGIVLKYPYLTFFASSYPLILFLTVYWALRSIKSRQMLLWGIACAIMIVAVAQAFIMKKKIFLGGAALLFAAVTVFNMNMLQTNKAGDVSLEAIMIMQQAESESNNPECHIDFFRQCSGKGGKYCNLNGTTCK